MSETITDPYEAYFEWCRANGFRDVADCKVEDLDVKRMDESIVAYVKAGRERSASDGQKGLS